jgi:hypothetical protein
MLIEQGWGMAESAGVEKISGVSVLALCDEYMLIEAIVASLQGREGVEIVLLDTSQPGEVQVPDRFSPDIIVFDLTPRQLNCALTFLRTHTNIVLIGLDIKSDQALFLSGEWRTLPTVAGLTQMIEARIQPKNSRQL